jgi:hypothetical protein
MHAIKRTYLAFSFFFVFHHHHRHRVTQEERAARQYMITYLASSAKGLDDAHVLAVGLVDESDLVDLCLDFELVHQRWRDAAQCVHHLLNKFLCSGLRDGEHGNVHGAVVVAGHAQGEHRRQEAQRQRLAHATRRQEADLRVHGLEVAKVLENPLLAALELVAVDAGNGRDEAHLDELQLVGQQLDVLGVGDGARDALEDAAPVGHDALALRNLAAVVVDHGHVGLVVEVAQVVLVDLAVRGRLFGDARERELAGCLCHGGGDGCVRASASVWFAADAARSSDALDAVHAACILEAIYKERGAY